MKKRIIFGTAVFGIVIALGLKPDNLLPDPKLTPGAVNPAISQENINQNICAGSAWSTKSIRPSTSYTNSLKVKQIKEYGYSDTKVGDYEEDHLISLVLGGSPTDPKNLWPESYNTSPNARDKDSVEMYLHKQVCSGQITLHEAQVKISTNWVEVYKQMKPTFGGLNYIDPDDN